MTSFFLCFWAGLKGSFVGAWEDVVSSFGRDGVWDQLEGHCPSELSCLGGRES